MSNQKKRIFQIEAFKNRVVVDPKYAEKTWIILEHAIHEIYNHNASGLSFEELYSDDIESLYKFVIDMEFWFEGILRQSFLLCFLSLDGFMIQKLPFCC
ncbi:hypothetical protein Gogos_008996 [Gossypium gossypioides]|uniref:Cullin N-terminal domain-containing protein n=1 Tax=Gossypium gossypioides TaxID=34282 RepID=A0A7J9CD81_GOSGO|nr:hypothetical protein [Gossypium gossypioides]